MILEFLYLPPSFHLVSSEIVRAPGLSFPSGGRAWLRCFRVGPAGCDYIDPVWRRLVLGSTDGASGEAMFPAFA